MNQNAPRTHVRPLRLADMVSRALRDRILSGELDDGDSLPTLEGLVEEFGVSPSSVREALRILETEGLVSVRRGKYGGAVVHRPSPDAAARMIGMVLQVEGATQVDLAAALSELEPVCASLVARRPDREKAVLAGLRDAHAAAGRAIDDPVEFERLARAFHTQVVAGCGNRTLLVTVGMLEHLWARQDIHWRQRINDSHDYPDPAVRRNGLDAHGAILAALSDGDADRAAALYRDHLGATAEGRGSKADLPVRSHDRR
ncbi:MAG: FadR family transcriptional regulator [Acidimicrobiales bacterium]|nr:FadR family transcriptional regulator [Acidimicrobiales bacterium]